MALSEADKDAVRAKVAADNDRMQTLLAPHYLGRLCPIDKQECRGMECFAFLLQLNEAGKVAGAACSIPLIAGQIGPIADGLMSFANQVASKSADVPRITGSMGGLIK